MHPLAKFLPKFFRDKIVKPEPPTVVVMSEVPPPVFDPIVSFKESDNIDLTSFNRDAVKAYLQTQVDEDMEKIRQAARGVWLFIRDEILAKRFTLEKYREYEYTSSEFSLTEKCVLVNDTKIVENSMFERTLVKELNKLAKEQGWEKVRISWSDRQHASSITIIEHTPHLPPVPPPIPASELSTEEVRKLANAFFNTKEAPPPVKEKEVTPESPPLPDLPPSRPNRAQRRKNRNSRSW